MMQLQVASQDVKKINVRKLLDWWKSNCDSPERLADFIVRGALSKKHLAEELVFARSTWQSNKRLGWAYNGISRRLIARGLLMPSDATETPSGGSSGAQNARDKQRIKTLELQVASLKEELKAAHEKIDRLGAIDDFIADCGRVPR